MCSILLLKFFMSVYIHRFTFAIRAGTHAGRCTVCPTRYRTRHFFNNFTTNGDIATKFEADLPHCVRNVRTSQHVLEVATICVFIGVRIIKEMPGSVTSGTRCIWQISVHDSCAKRTDSSVTQFIAVDLFNKIFIYSRIPLVRIHRDGEPSGYVENPDNWIFRGK